MAYRDEEIGRAISISSDELGKNKKHVNGEKLKTYHNQSVRRCLLRFTAPHRSSLFIRFQIFNLSTFLIVVSLSDQLFDFEGMELKTISFTLNQLKSATGNFNGTNKIGEEVLALFTGEKMMMGMLSDKNINVVKQLSSESRQGNRKFLNEVGVISCLQHPNLVKLHGCCIEGDQLMLLHVVGLKNGRLILDWSTRFKICVRIARGLAFLHEESRLKIVHRDIKPTNVLVDKDLNPKIADFGLARLHDEGQTHVSTRVAGTILEYLKRFQRFLFTLTLLAHSLFFCDLFAEDIWHLSTHCGDFLSDKAHVYSFGVLALEIVSSKHNTSYIARDNYICLLHWSPMHLQIANIHEFCMAFFEEFIDADCQCDMDFGWR
ncbi:LOW QUALITY PROTEIN: hypothetical protein OSB04_027638 [Centaurea solstitialis]|uniref:non-specific serine/threonine protein kinase n=1 Tax=Centaurea solstitialis TaxID=347529 RepID=A0AA38VWW5_9ASTR|nr:LOW QUALITY PROTEIN: hypothetical protein OSB04_027638 [Centaurea solstitialis]